VGDYDHPGHRRHLGDNFWGAGEPFQRERTRSPPRRNHAGRQVWHHNQAAQAPATPVNVG
jgi:hypothetical protein